MVDINHWQPKIFLTLVLDKSIFNSNYDGVTIVQACWGSIMAKNSSFSFKSSLDILSLEFTLDYVYFYVKYVYQLTYPQDQLWIETEKNKLPFFLARPVEKERRRGLVVENR